MTANISYPNEFAAPLRSFCKAAGIRAHFKKAGPWVRITGFKPEASIRIAEAGHEVRSAMTATTTWRLARKNRGVLAKSFKALSAKRAGR
jgi:hypothetical protein